MEDCHTYNFPVACARIKTCKQGNVTQCEKLAWKGTELVFSTKSTYCHFITAALVWFPTSKRISLVGYQRGKLTLLTHKQNSHWGQRSTFKCLGAICLHMCPTLKGELRAFMPGQPQRMHLTQLCRFGPRPHARAMTARPLWAFCGSTPLSCVFKV